MRYISFFMFVALLLFGMSSCKKLVTVSSPTTSLVSATVFSSDASATAAVSGIYSRMIAGNGYAGTGISTGGFASGNQSSMTFLGSLSADEHVNYASSGTAQSLYFYGNAVPSSTTGSFWGEIYQYIYTANAGIEGLADSSTAVSSSLRRQLTGECKFIRGFCYFYLVNTFGDVPLITGSNYIANQYAPRAAQADVYTQIVRDLLDAESLLGSDYSSLAGGERIRPIKWTAAALLARTYLYMGRWADAEREASSVIGSGMYQLPSDLSAVFLKNSDETIWALRPAVPDQNTPDAMTFLLTDAPSTAINNVTLLGKLLTSFEPGDLRRTVWVDSIISGGQTYCFASKYRAGAAPGIALTEYSMVMRVAEQYLIRAEARAQLNKFGESADDLNVIRLRAGLAVSNAATLPSLLTAILHERQTELFTEWGHRWLDLKRTNSIDSVMTVACPLKGATWTPTAALWPIPLSELQADHYLTQNPGYN